MKRKTAEKHFRLHRFLYRFARTVLSPLILKKYSYTTDICPPLTESCMILSNHLTERDMFMVSAAFPEHMYFVCGEHLMRSKIGGLLRATMAPIPAPRGGNMAAAVIAILRRLKSGHNVMMFPEGCRSFHGETLPIPDNTAALIKKAGCGLVTYRITGGYFIAPRWSYQPRTGPAAGTVVRIYSSREIAEMTVGELNAHINEDLHENAYETQKAKMLAYRSDKKAEGLENYLLLCPVCGAFDSYETSGNRFRCKTCGLSGEYDDYGMLAGTALPFSTVYDWGKWMEIRFDTLIGQRGETDLLFSENNVTLYRIQMGKGKTDIAKGRLDIYKDRIALNGMVFPFREITAKSLLYFGKTWLFTCPSGYYGLTGDAFHAWKTDRIFDLRKNGKNGDFTKNGLTEQGKI